MSTVFIAKRVLQFIPSSILRQMRYANITTTSRHNDKWTLFLRARLRNVLHTSKKQNEKTVDVEGNDATKLSKENEGSNTSALSWAKYTTQQKEKILKLINSKESTYLQNYDLSKARANRIATWKRRNGPFKDIEDILLVEGFNPKAVEKFYRSILINPDGATAASKLKRTRGMNFVTPNVDPIHLQHVKSCVAIRVGPASVTWSRLQLSPNEFENSSALLTHWQHHEINDKKLHLFDLVQRCLYVNHLIPHADCYLFESPQMAHINANQGNVQQQNVNIQKSQLIAMLGYALSSRHRSEEEFCKPKEENSAEATSQEEKRRKDVPISKVFYLRRFLAARLYNQLIGTERISSENTILELMRMSDNEETLPNECDDLNTSVDKQTEILGFSGVSENTFGNGFGNTVASAPNTTIGNCNFIASNVNNTNYEPNKPSGFAFGIQNVSSNCNSYVLDTNPYACGSDTLQSSTCVNYTSYTTDNPYACAIGTGSLSSIDISNPLCRSNSSGSNEHLNDMKDVSDNINSDINPKNRIRADVIFPIDLRAIFFQSERVQREFLGQSLLINLAFIRLVLQQDPESIAQVTRTAKV